MTTTIAKRDKERQPEMVPRTWFRRGPLNTFRHEMEEVLGSFFSDVGEGLLAERMIPSLDVSETDDALEVRMDLPGVKPADIDVQVHGDLLTIRGKRTEEKEEKGRTFHIVERSRGSFSRTVTLPCATQEGQADADYKDGVLTVRIPKAAESKSQRVAVKEA